MPRFTAETAIAALEIEQLVIDWGYDLDLNGGMNVAPLCTDDCHYLVGGTLHQGHGPITAFYTARNERVATQQKDGVRTQRHTITNMRIQFPAADHGSAQLLHREHRRRTKLDVWNPAVVVAVLG